MAKPGLIKHINRNAVIDLLRDEGMLTRANLARKLNLTRSTVTNIVNDLIAEEMVIETEDNIPNDTTGRPGIGITLNPDGAYFLGIEVGVEYVELVLASLRLDVLTTIQEDLPSHPSPATVFDIIERLVETAIDQHVRDANRIQGTGITVPGLLGRDGTVLKAPNLGWENIPFKEDLQKRFAHKVYVENDANASALGEIFSGEYDKTHTMLYLLLSNGIGGGICIDRQIFRGARGIAGEFGQIRLSKDGPPCVYGGQGCFEAFVGKQGLIQSFQRFGGQHTSLNSIVEAIRQGDPAGLKTIEYWGFWLGQGLMTLINSFNPDSIVLGGPLSVLWPFVEDSVMEFLRSEHIPGNEDVEVLQGSVDNPCSVGAAIMVYTRSFEIDY